MGWAKFTLDVVCPGVVLTADWVHSILPFIIVTDGNVKP